MLPLLTYAIQAVLPQMWTSGSVTCESRNHESGASWFRQLAGIMGEVNLMQPGQ
jgi:hypothetical protein